MMALRCLLVVISIIVGLAGTSYASAKTVVDFWKGPHTTGFTTETERPAFAPIIEKFEKENPEIKVVYTIIPWMQYNEKLTAGLFSRRPPDVIFCPLEWVTKFADAGQLLELNQYIPDYLKELEAVIKEESWKAGMYKGEQIGIPWLEDGFFLFWNKDLYRKAGLDPNIPPQTWDELVQMAQRLTKDTDNDAEIDQYGLAIAQKVGYASSFWFYCFLFSSGADILNEDWSGNGFNNPEGLRALQYYVDLYNKYKVTPPALAYTRDELGQMFFDGRVGMIIEENIYSGQLVREHPEIEFGVDKVPAGPAGSLGWGSVGQTMVAKHTSELEASLAWFRYVNSKEVVETYIAHNTDFWPARQDVELVDPRKPANWALKVMGGKRQFTKLMPTHPDLDRINMIIWSAVERALLGTSVDTAFAEAAKEVDQVCTFRNVRPGGYLGK